MSWVGTACCLAPGAPTKRGSHRHTRCHFTFSRWGPEGGSPRSRGTSRSNLVTQPHHGAQAWTGDRSQDTILGASGCLCVAGVPVWLPKALGAQTEGGREAGRTEGRSDSFAPSYQNLISPPLEKNNIKAHFAANKTVLSNQSRTRRTSPQAAIYKLHGGEDGVGAEKGRSLAPTQPSLLPQPGGPACAQERAPEELEGPCLEAGQSRRCVSGPGHPTSLREKPARASNTRAERGRGPERGVAARCHVSLVTQDLLLAWSELSRAALSPHGHVPSCRDRRMRWKGSLNFVKIHLLPFLLRLLRQDRSPGVRPPPSGCS